MEFFRKKTITRIFSLFTGVIFLNMSFFLAEVCMLDLKDKQMIENVCNLVINAGMEEERDAHSTGADVSMKEIPFMAAGLLFKHSSLFLIACKVHVEFEDHYLHADHSIKFSPPPDLVSLHS
ncbi:MAG: hypothetical protein WA874_10165 [Chryseosolibacter sp.]